MTSHSYRLTYNQTVQTLLCPCVVLVAIWVTIALAEVIGLLPKPWPALDMDRTILLHKALAARQTSSAEIVLLGDSSCLMNVDAAALSSNLAKPTLNLATLSYIGLPTHAHLVRKFVQTNPDHVRTVVLLLHPQTLRLGEVSTQHVSILMAALTQNTDCRIETVTNIASLPSLPKHSPGPTDLFALKTARERIFTRIVPIPLPGEYGRTYGFTHDLWRYLTLNKGSLIDPHQLAPTTPKLATEFRLASRFKAEAEMFSQICPRELVLLVGLTPTPTSFAQPNHHQVCTSMLKTLGDWIRADVILTNLPLSMPDELFASATHLNRNGRTIFTHILTEELRENRKIARPLTPSP